MVTSDGEVVAVAAAKSRIRLNSDSSRMRWSDGATMIAVSEGLAPDSETRDEITAFAYAMHGAVLRIHGSHKMLSGRMSGR